MKTNDMYLVIYISSIIRSVTALHDLLQNKIRFNEVTCVCDSMGYVLLRSQSEQFSWLQATNKVHEAKVAGESKDTKNKVCV